MTDQVILQLSNPKRAKFTRWMLVPVPSRAGELGPYLVAEGPGGSVVPAALLRKDLVAVRMQGTSDQQFEISKWVLRASDSVPDVEVLAAEVTLSEVAVTVTIYEGGRRHDLKIATNSLAVVDGVGIGQKGLGSCTRFRGVAGNSDFCLRFWVDAYPDTGIVDWWATITYASALRPEYNVSIDSLILEIPSASLIDVSDSRVWNNADLSRSRSAISLARAVTLHDGASVAVRGTALVSKTKSCVDNYDAVLGAGPGVAMTATADSWEGDWVAPYGNVPQVSASEAHFQALRAIQRRKDYLNGVIALPPSIDASALAADAIKYPGQQGDQVDFGVTYGAAELANPAAIELLEQRLCADFLRGYMLSRPMYNLSHKPGRHYDVVRSYFSRPNWSTYNGRTWDRSEDKLDKTLPFNSANGWQPYDEQHRSHNQLAAYLRLVSDPRVIELVRMMQNVDFADARLIHRTQGSPRAIGRQIGAWAQLAAATCDDNYCFLAELLIMRARSIGTARAWQLDIAHYGVISDARYPVYDSAGMLATVVSVWEHALMLFGLHQILCTPGVVLSIDGAAKARRMAKECARMVLLSLRDGQVCTAFSTYEHDGQTLVMKPGNSSGTAGWVIFASYLARAVYADDSADAPPEQIEAWNQHFPIPTKLPARLGEAEWLAALPRSRSQHVPSQSTSS